MKRKRLTQSLCGRATAGDKRQRIFDSEMPGLCLKIEPSGRKAFVCRGARKRDCKWTSIDLQLGLFGEIRIELAAAAAGRILSR